MFQRLIICVATCAFVLCPLFFASVAVADEEKESLIKAAFIFNFIKFVEWPDGKAIKNQSKIDICVLGDSGINNASGVFKQASTDKLTLTLVPEQSARSAASHCHIVFVGGSAADNLTEVIGTLKSHSVLTVGDAPGFAEHGGMIGFVMSDNKVKLAVNKRAIEASGMRVDAQLLEIALQVIK